MATKVINSLTFGDTYVFTTPYATSSTAAGTAAKVATTTPNSNFLLETGVRVTIKFTYANTANSPTLNVNNSGAKTIRFRGAAITSHMYRWAAGSVVDFVFDGTYWNMTAAPNNNDSNDCVTVDRVDEVSSGDTFSVLLTYQNPGSDYNDHVFYTPKLCFDDGLNRLFIDGEESCVAATYFEENGDALSNKYAAKDHTHPHYTTKLFATSSTGTAHAATTNGNTYLRLFDDNTARQSIKIRGEGATSVSSDANGVITIKSHDYDTLLYHSSAVDSFGPNLMDLVMYPLSDSYGEAETYVQHGETLCESSSLQYYPEYSDAGYHGTLYNTGDIVVRGGDAYGVVPESDNYSTLGREGQSWWQVYAYTYYDGSGTNLDDKYAPADHSHSFSDTKVTQTAAITATTSANYPVMLGYSTATTAVTNTLNKSAKLLFNTGTGNLSIGTSGTDGSGSITLEGSLTLGTSQSDSQGIMPRASNWNSLGLYNKYWYRSYVSTVYCNSIKKLDGTAFNFGSDLTWNTF